MSKLKNFKEIHYGKTPNDLLNDSRISLKAKGLFGYMQSKPDSWDFTISSLSACLKEGENAIETAIKELSTFGWIKVSNFQNEKGQWDSEYQLFANPYKISPKGEKPTPDFPAPVFPTPENHPSYKERERKKDYKEGGGEQPAKKEIGRSFNSSVLDYLLDQIPELTGYPGLRPIVESLEQREDYKPYIQFVRVNKKPKIFEITGWRKWFYEDYLSSQYTQKTKREEGTTWTDEEYIAFMKKQGMEKYI